MADGRLLLLLGIFTSIIVVSRPSALLTLLLVVIQINYTESFCSRIQAEPLFSWHKNANLKKKKNIVLVYMICTTYSVTAIQFLSVTFLALKVDC